MSKQCAPTELWPSARAVNRTLRIMNDWYIKLHHEKIRSRLDVHEFSVDRYFRSETKLPPFAFEAPILSPNRQIHRHRLIFFCQVIAKNIFRSTVCSQQVVNHT